MKKTKLNFYAIPDGSPALEVDNDPLAQLAGRTSKAVVLVCPECGERAIFLERSDTTKKFGDPADECHSCLYGLYYEGVPYNDLP